MAATYNPALTAPRDRVRLTVGDIDVVAHAELPDETYDYVITNTGSELEAAYRIALTLAAKWARFVEVTVDHQTTRANQIFENYTALAKSLYAQLTQGVAGSTVEQSGIYVSGIGDTTGPFDVWTLPQNTLF